jgi:seryl-tRNA synthetase
VQVPQIPAVDAPRGDESKYIELKKVGAPTHFDFEPKDHITLGKLLDLIDIDRGAAVSGYRGYYLKNEAALMHHGLMQLGLQIMRKNGFTVMVPPTIVRDRSLVGSGHFPFGQAEVYQIANPSRLADGAEQKESQYLVGTAEPSLLAYYADQVLDAADLPLKACGISQCYRSEVGSYGKDTKGIYRIHEFMKVEQVVLVEADEAAQQKAFDEMLAIAEELLATLEVPYRVIDIPTGDMGAGKVRQYDIETWMPSRTAYGETHSNSMLGDWQARRLNIKYKTADGKKSHVFTLNNTVIASPRILIALLENHQQVDGSVRIPAVLQPFVGASEIRPK